MSKSLPRLAVSLCACDIHGMRKSLPTCSRLDIIVALSVCLETSLLAIQNVKEIASLDAQHICHKVNILLLKETCDTASL